jgi:hypothetical protein
LGAVVALTLATRIASVSAISIWFRTIALRTDARLAVTTFLLLAVVLALATLASALVVLVALIVAALVVAALVVLVTLAPLVATTLVALTAFPLVVLVSVLVALGSLTLVVLAPTLVALSTTSPVVSLLTLVVVVVTVVAITAVTVTSIAVITVAVIAVVTVAVALVALCRGGRPVDDSTVNGMGRSRHGGGGAGSQRHEPGQHYRTDHLANLHAVSGLHHSTLLLSSCLGGCLNLLLTEERSLWSETPQGRQSQLFWDPCPGPRGTNVPCIPGVSRHQLVPCR